MLEDMPASWHQLLKNRGVRIVYGHAGSAINKLTCSTELHDMARSISMCMRLCSARLLVSTGAKTRKSTSLDFRP